MTQKKSNKAPEKKTNKKVGASADSIKEIEELTSQLEEANQAAKDNWEKLLRSQAEMENLKHRNAKDIENAHKYALDGFAKALLEVKDSLAMGIKSASDENASMEKLLEGVVMTDKVFTSTLEKFGIKEINPKEGKFDPEFHEAVTMIPVPDKQTNDIVDVVQIGFTLNDRVLRPAMVVVAQ